MLKYILLIVLTVLIMQLATALAQPKLTMVPPLQMQKVYEEVRTPFKYGLVLVPPTVKKKVDCPSVFCNGEMWYMTYIVYDGRGYETWLAKSKNLLSWETLGPILSFSDDTTRWDNNQKGGYIALQDPEWGGSYQWLAYKGKHWMSYLGGNKRGYEAGQLSVGMAFTEKDPATAHEWQLLGKPVLRSSDKDVRWWENATQYKSSVIQDKQKLTGHEFVMYYNAYGDSINPKKGAERIGMAVSDDMVNWKRYLKDPVLNHHRGITGDATLQKMGDLWVMFYFGAFWPEGRKDAFDRFACSYDLVNWTDWTGDDLIKPSETYDEVYAHKPCVVKWDGVVYHFYCSVDKNDNRGIAVATSSDKGKSNLSYKSDFK
jgi:predicted GH43/DUF377 family glycosyl hydrolase